jgi:hypothetical protein
MRAFQGKRGIGEILCMILMISKEKFRVAFKDWIGSLEER